MDQHINLIYIAFICVVFATATSPSNCDHTVIKFVRKEGTCYDYERGFISPSTSVVRDPYRINYFADTLLPFCTTEICGDGRYHTFCTTSGTSVGDCIPGDAAQNFAKIYEGRVDSVAIQINTLLVIPAIATALVHEFTTEDRSIRIYEHGGYKGENLVINSKKGQCIDLPKEWQMRVSSYGSKNQATFYTGENCTGQSAVACRDFVKNDFWAKSENLWGLLCKVDGLNDNTRSFKFE